MVRSLLRHRASATRTERTNSKPLTLPASMATGENQTHPEVTNRLCHMCLMISCYKGHREIARHLLEQCAQVNRHRASGNTTLQD